MSIFSKKTIIDAKAQEYINKINSFVDASNDENKLNLMFTDITILRMKLDGADGLFKNIKDFRERKKSLNRNDLIKVQIYDICEDYKKYKPEQIIEIDKIMLKLLPQEKNKSIWDFLKECLDNATGKQKK